MKRASHEGKVYREQDEILVVLKRKKDFPYVLSGGTALSRFYFHHRFSEDLDFFCERATYSFEKIEEIVNYLRKAGFRCELVARSDLPRRLKAATYTVSSHDPIKVDFLEDPFSGMWDPVQRKTESGLSFRVDALDQIYYRKLFSLLEQWHRTREITRTKDLVDVYSLHRYHRSLEATIPLFRKNHVPVDEEKLIMILAGLKKKGLEGDVWKALKTSGEKLLREGISK